MWSIWALEFPPNAPGISLRAWILPSMRSWDSSVRDLRLPRSRRTLSMWWTPPAILPPSFPAVLLWIPKIVEKCTLPLTGYKVVDMIVTELCVLKVTPEGLELAEYNPELGDRDIAIRIIQEKTAAKLHISPDLKPMRLPD